MLQDKMMTSFFDLLLLANASLQAADQSIPIEIRPQIHLEVEGTNKSRTIPSPKGRSSENEAAAAGGGTGGGEIGPKKTIG